MKGYPMLEPDRDEGIAWFPLERFLTLFGAQIPLGAIYPSLGQTCPYSDLSIHALLDEAHGPHRGSNT